MGAMTGSIVDTYHWGETGDENGDVVEVAVPLPADEREVQIPMAPSRRLMDTTKYRAFKLIQDRQVWETAWSRVEALVADGWTVEKVCVDWGQRLPGIGDEREAFIRRMCGGVRQIEQDVSGQGKGRTTVYLRREPRGGRVLFPDGIDGA